MRPHLRSSAFTYAIAIIAYSIQWKLWPHTPIPGQRLLQPPNLATSGQIRHVRRYINAATLNCPSFNAHTVSPACSWIALDSSGINTEITTQVTMQVQSNSQHRDNVCPICQTQSSGQKYLEVHVPAVSHVTTQCTKSNKAKRMQPYPGGWSALSYQPTKPSPAQVRQLLLSGDTLQPCSTHATPSA